MSMSHLDVVSYSIAGSMYYSSSLLLSELVEVLLEEEDGLLLSASIPTSVSGFWVLANAFISM